MPLTPEQIARYERDGFLVLENFVDEKACDRLRARAAELVRDFDPQGVVSIFSTHEQTRTSDDYFLESGDKVRFFFEENAFLPDGTLRQSKERSINKIGHALHDLDPVFDQFSRTPAIKQLISDFGIVEPLLLQSMYIFKQPRIGGEVTCPSTTLIVLDSGPEVSQGSHHPTTQDPSDTQRRLPHQVSGA